MNLLSQFIAASGVSKVPTPYLTWSFLSTVAACVADRVWYERAPGHRVRPNLYVLLLGPSGIGKGDAIKEVLKLVADIPQVRLYQGRATAEFIRDRLGKVRHRPDGTEIPPIPQLFLVNEELVFCVGVGPPAFEMVSVLVQIYGGNPAAIRDGTRTRGEIVMHNPCVNWLAGTNRAWLVRSMPDDAVAGGLSRRLVVVEQDYRDVRITHPQFPPEREAWMAEIEQRLLALTECHGAFTADPDALAVFDEWYQQRPLTDDVALRPWWETQDELVLKVSMIMSLCESDSLRIERRHMVKAQTMTEETKKWVSNAIEYTTARSDSTSLHYAQELIQSAGQLSDRVLAQKLAGRGVLKNEKMEIVETLLGAGEIVRMVQGPRGATWYQWVSRRRMPEGEETS